MAPLRDLTEFYDPDLLLPISGVTYRVKSPGIREAERLRLLILDNTLAAADEYAEIVKILGPALDEMARNGVPDSMAMHAGRTALLHFGGSSAMGRSHWQLAQLGDLVNVDELLAATAPNQPAKNRAARRRSRRKNSRTAPKPTAAREGSGPTD